MLFDTLKVVMPGANCSIYGCSVSRRPEYKGLSLFKVPAGKSDFDKNWRDKLISIITKDRVIDNSLRGQIEKCNLHICQRHFKEDEYYKHNTKATLNPGVLPTLNLPTKSHPSSSTITKPRDSASTIINKRELFLYASTTQTSSSYYKSFDDFKNRVSSLKLNSWVVSSPSTSCMSFFHHDQTHSVPKFEIYVDQHLDFVVRALLWSVPVKHEIYENHDRSVKNVTISNLCSLVSSLTLCPGLSEKFSASCLEHTVPKIFMGSFTSSPLFQTKWYRPTNCYLLIQNGIEKCAECILVEKKEDLSLKRKSANMNIPAKPKAPITLTSPQRVKLYVQELRHENKQLRVEINKKSVPVPETLGDDLATIMSGADQSKITPFMKKFWAEQQNYLSTSKKGVRYHPMIIRYCLALAAKSPAVYDDIRYDEKNKTGFLILPSRRRLRDYKNYIRPQQGFNPPVIKELANIVSKFQEIEKYCIILMDEMKIQENLVWDKHTGDLIGFVDLGDTELNYATLPKSKSEDIASHVLVFLVRSIVNPLKFSLANFATSNATSIQLFPLFWKAVGILEDNVGMKVVGVTSDGASPNRTMYRMHQHMERVEDFNPDIDVTYRTLNIMAEEKRFIYFISDPPHLIKTSRNCLLNSLSGRATRSMWNDGHYLTWNHISKLFHDDLDCGLHLVPKITNEHISLTPFSVMNVRLAAQVLSESVFQALQTYGPPDAIGTATYCRMLDKFFDCMNVRNSVECVRKQKPFLKPYENLDDERFTWLIDTFLKYFTDWKISIADRNDAQYTDNARANMFISWQTYEGLQLTVYSSIELIKYLLSQNVPYVFTERFCQDPLENYFGQQRSIGHRKDNPSLRDFGYNDNTIRTSKLFRPIAGNCRNDDPILATIDVETVPCRKRNKKN